MSTKSFTFNIPFQCSFCIDKDIDTQMVKDAIQKLLDYYSDGRTNLERECMERDMSAFLRQAMEMVVYELTKNKCTVYNMIEVEPGVFSSQGIIDCENIIKSIKYAVAKIQDPKE